MAVPQPGPDRIELVAGRPLVVGITPGQSPVVALTAAVWAQALATSLHFGYADPDRVVIAELDDGDVRHAALSPDAADDSWRRRDAQLRAALEEVLAGRSLTWRFHYLAGRPDRALTHLARTVDAAAIVVAARRPVGADHRLTGLLAGTVGAHLARHQHRPVLTVPVQVVDWRHQSS